MTFRSGRSVLLVSVLAVLAFFSAAPAVDAVECGDTLLTSVQLDRDLLDCPGVGLFIGANDVTIDLNGHTLDGDEGQENAIETVTDRSGITVKGPGVIRGFNNGIEVGGAKLKVLGVTFRDLADAALNVGPCAGSVVAGNVFVDVGQVMDFAAGSGKVLVKGNVAARVDVGIVVGDAAGAQVVDNLVADVSSAQGILVAGPGAVVKGNRVARTADHGIQLFDVTDGKVIGNSVTETIGAGIALGTTRTTRLERNVVSGAGDAGIRILDDLADGNRLQRNVVLGGGGRGVFVPVGADTTFVEGNVVEGNALDGIRVEQAGTFVKKNRADGNGGAGIVAVAGAIDGGANRARGNGGAQCDGVACP